jgi:hypothetical protein
MPEIQPSAYWFRRRHHHLICLPAHQIYINMDLFNHPPAGDTWSQDTLGQQVLNNLASNIGGSGW